MTLNYACIFGRSSSCCTTIATDSPTARRADGGLPRPGRPLAGRRSRPGVWTGFKGMSRAVRDRRQLLHAHPRPEPDDAPRPVRQRHPVRLGRPPSLIDRPDSQRDGGGRRRSRAARPRRRSSIRSAAASPATACARPCGDRRARPARRARGADRNAGVRLDGPARVEHPRRVRRRTPTGERVVDFDASQPPRRRLQRAGATRDAARRAAASTCTTIPEHPDWIPYRTSYYREDWGFCLSHDALLALEDGEYEVLHRHHARGRPPHLRRVLPARRERATRCWSRRTSATRRSPTTTSRASRSRRFLARTLARAAAAALLPVPLRPGHDRRDHLAGTRTSERVARIKHGLVLTCVGDAGQLDLQAQPARRRGDRPRRRARARPLGRAVRASSTSRPTATTSASTARPASTCRSGCFMRTPLGPLPRVPHLGRRPRLRARRRASPTRSRRCSRRSAVLEGDATLRQPQPVRRAAARPARAVPARSAAARTTALGELALLWVLNLSDGRHSLLDIAERSGLEFGVDPGCGRPRSLDARNSSRRQRGMRVLVTGTEGYIGSPARPVPRSSAATTCVGVDTGFYQVGLALQRDAASRSRR